MPKAPLISLIDDDDFCRESMRRLMRSLGYTVEAFVSPADFLASPRLAETAFVDGGYTIPTILVTGYPDADNVLNDGLVCYLRKPVNENHLIRALRAALQSGEPPAENS
jgi:FixJ family two-component response regulator